MFIENKLFTFSYGKRFDTESFKPVMYLDWYGSKADPNKPWHEYSCFVVQIGVFGRELLLEFKWNHIGV